MKRAFTFVTSATMALGIVGSVAVAAPISKSTAMPASKSVAKANKMPSKAPKTSKWQQHVLEELKVAAPGDEYFGRMKMSYLGINNTFHDDLIRAGQYTTDTGLISQVSFADEALEQWAHKYPKDPQLARSYFLAFQMYRKIWTQPAQDKAWQYMHIIVERWPSSFFGKTMKGDMKKGFTEHYFATAVQCPALDPTATPAPTSAPTPAPTPAPGHPAVMIMPVACFTPMPSESMPGMMPSASPSPH